MSYDFCEWPNQLRSNGNGTVVPSLDERRAAWSALAAPVARVVAAPAVVESVSRLGRNPRYRPQMLPSGMPRPSSTGWRASHLAEQLLPANVAFYRGPSVLTGEPIVCIGGQRTINAKTGPMVQVWILRADMDPIEAVKTGADDAICGDCKLRGDHGKDRACYVQWFRAPVNIFRSKQLEWSIYKFAEAVAGKQVRLGAYGDPAAVPWGVWAVVLQQAAGWTGYTHQWKTCAPEFKAFVMASVDSPSEQREAAALGWRTFRVRADDDDALFTNEVACPASDEMNHRTTCARCCLCRGTARPAKHVAIIAHGQPRSVSVFRRIDFEAVS